MEFKELLRLNLDVWQEVPWGAEDIKRTGFWGGGSYLKFGYGTR